MDVLYVRNVQKMNSEGLSGDYNALKSAELKLKAKALIIFDESLVPHTNRKNCLAYIIQNIIKYIRLIYL